MIPDNNPEHPFFASLARLLGSEGPKEDASVADAPPLSEELRTKFRVLVQRTGYIDSYRCVIEETPWGTFRLHGLPHGHSKKLYCFTRGIADQLDGPRHPVLAYSLEIDDSASLVTETAGAVYLLPEIHSPLQANSFFDPKNTWSASPQLPSPTAQTK